MRIAQDLFNSEMFKIKMGNVIMEEEGSLTDVELETINYLAKAEKYQHISIRIPSEDKQTLNRAIRKGFYLTDILVEFVFERGYLQPYIQSECLFHECRESEISDLKEVAKKAFVYDRYHSDQNLENYLCDSYYENWFENSCRGFAEKVIVAEYQGVNCGFFTCNTSIGDDYGHLVLGAIKNEYQGHGIFGALVQTCTTMLLENHAEIRGVKVGTQLVNIPAQRAYMKAGYKILDSIYVLHKSMIRDE